MFALFYRNLVRPKTALSDLTGAAQLFVRWFCLPGRRAGKQILIKCALEIQRRQRDRAPAALLEF